MSTAGAGSIASTLIRRARLVPLGSAFRAPDELVDVRIRGGVVQAVAPGLRAAGDEQVVDAAGRWAAPGLWDAHVHLAQWAQSLVRLDVSGTSAPAEVGRLAAGADRRRARCGQR